MDEIADHSTTRPREPERRRPVTGEIQLHAAVRLPCLLRRLDPGHENGRFFSAAEHLGRGPLGDPAGELIDELL